MPLVVSTALNIRRQITKRSSASNKILRLASKRLSATNPGKRTCSTRLRICSRSTRRNGKTTRQDCKTCKVHAPPLPDAPRYANNGFHPEQLNGLASENTHLKVANGILLHHALTPSPPLPVGPNF